MNIDKINQYMELDNLWIYNSVLNPFIRQYLRSDQTCKYKLFYSYIFQYSRLEKLFMDREIEKSDQYYLTKDNKHLDLRYHYIQKYFVSYNKSYFIGYTSNNLPLFLHLHKNKHNYFYSGFMIDVSNNQPEYNYLVNDYKIYQQMQNLPIYGIEKYELIDGKNQYSPIYQMLEKFNS